MQDFQITEKEEQEVSTRDMLGKYLRYWPWFLLTVVLALTGAFIYLRYTVPTYRTSTRIIINDNKSVAPEVSALQNLGVLSDLNSNSLDNEIEVLKSIRLMKPVVEKLGLNVTYALDGRFIKQEVYDYQPFTIKVLNYHKGVPVPNQELGIRLINEEGIQIRQGESIKDYPLGTTIDMGFAEVIVLPKFQTGAAKNDLDTREYLVRFYSVESMAGQLSGRIQVSPSKRGSSVMQLSMVYPVRAKSEDILNALVDQYNEDAIKDNNLVAKNTAEFIDERLKIISGELDSVETNKVDFKVSNMLIDPKSEASVITGAAQQVLETQLDLSTRISVIRSLIDYLEKKDNSKLLPVNLGEEGSASGLIANYNSLVLERNELRKHTTEKNPVLRNLDVQINDLRETILESLDTEINTLKVTLSELSARESRLNREIAAAPGKEKVYRHIERQQGIKEALYLFLLQKREEASISMAINAPKAKVVDYARSSGVAVSPQRNKVYGGAFVLGLLIPFLVVYIRDTLNDKIISRKDIEKRIPELPIVGELPKVEEKDKQFIATDGRSVLAESFRILRTNLQYMFVDRENEEGAKTILVTSTTKGEGKSLTATNLAISLAGTGKNVLLIGADLRNPQLGRYFDHDRNRTGLSHYLYNKSTRVEEIMYDSDVSGLTLITSGSIPPNPAELLLSSRLRELFSILKEQYDYIVIDTAPLLLVTDTFLINKYADVVLYVMRSGYTEIKFTDFVKDALKAKKLDKVALVLNDVSMADFGYGNKYGYSYYGRERETFFGKLKKRLSA